MKAVQWIPLFKENLPKALEDFVQETVELALIRGNTDNAREGAFKEQQQKFRAIQRQFPVDERLLHEAYEAFAPEYYASLSVYQQKLYELKEAIRTEYALQQELALVTDPKVRLFMRLNRGFREMI